MNAPALVLADDRDSPLGWALRYAALRCPVLPIFEVNTAGVCSCRKGCGCANPGKHPRIAGGVHAASIDDATIRKWWSQWPRANVAVATGQRSGLLVVDVDPRNDGDATLAALEADHGVLPAAPRQRTGGGGFHLMLRADGPVRCSVLGAGVDVKGDGGYVLVAPSNHVCGVYSWDPTCHIEEAEPPVMPDWLARAVRSPLPVTQGTSVGIDPEIPVIQVTTLHGAVDACLFTSRGESEKAIRKLVRRLKFDLGICDYPYLRDAVVLLYDRCGQHVDPSHGVDYLVAKAWRFMQRANQPVGAGSNLAEAIRLARASPSARAEAEFRGEHCRLLVPICRELAKMSPTGIFSLGGGELVAHLGGKRGHWWERLRTNLEPAGVIRLDRPGRASSDPKRRQSNLYSYLWPLDA